MLAHHIGRTVRGGRQRAPIFARNVIYDSIVDDTIVLVVRAIVAVDHCVIHRSIHQVVVAAAGTVPTGQLPDVVVEDRRVSQLHRLLQAVVHEY